MSRAVYETDQTDQADHTLKAPAGPQAGGRMRRQLVVGGAIVAVAMLVIGIIVLTSGSTSSKRTVRSRGSLSTPSAGILTTAAGDGNEGFAGDGKPALVAHLSRPSGVAV